MKRDVFLSYSSADRPWVEKLKLALECRGVSVWLDKDDIRPGDYFARSIEEALRSSRAVVVVLTPSSLRSNWVAEECYRALSLANEGAMRVVPVLLGDAQAPGFLSSRHCVRFPDDGSFEAQADRLVWPGISGKSVRGLTFDHGDRHDEDARRLHECVEEELGTTFCRLSSSRMHEWFPAWRTDGQTMGHHTFPPGSCCGVIVLDFPDPPPHGGYQCYVDFILRCRGSADGVNETIQFVIYQTPGWLDRLAEDGIDPAVVGRLSHYFTVEKTADATALRRDLRRVWNLVQRDLMRREHDA